MKILIIYATGEGQTRKVARFMEEVLQEENHKVVIADATEEPPKTEGYDIVFVGASIHMYQYQKPIGEYIRMNSTNLNKIPSAFFSVCLMASGESEEEKAKADKLANEFVEEHKWQPNRIIQIPGALRFTKYNFFKKILMRMISNRKGNKIDTSKDHEYTDWEAVKRFCLVFMSDFSK